MGCQHFDAVPGGAEAFTVAMPKYTFGRGCLAEAGVRARSHGMKNIALFTDQFLEHGPYFETVAESLRREGLQVTVFSDVRIEPDDDTVERAAKFLADGSFDGVVSMTEPPPRHSWVTRRICCAGDCNTRNRTGRMILN